MKIVVLLLAIAMPVIGWLSNTGMFGPTNGEISDRYPTLIVAAGYAFSIWGLIFLLDIVHALRQFFTARRSAASIAVQPAVAVAFALTSAWMIVFSQQWFWLALAIIWASLACLWYAAWRLNRDTDAAADAWSRCALSLHAGWVSLAVFLDVAQVIVSQRLLSATQMLPWTLVLFALAAVLLLASLAWLRGSAWYALAAVWGLVGVFVKQRAAGLPGANIAAWVAVLLAVLVVAQAAWQWRRWRARSA